MKVDKSVIKDLWIILGIEVLTVPVIIAYFKLIEPKKVAAVIAAITFVLTGLFIIRMTRKWPEAFASFVYWAVHVHVFIFSIPMLVARVVFWEKEFEDIKFLTFTGPEFHKISEKGYLVLLVATLVDIIVHTIKLKKQSLKKDK